MPATAVVDSISINPSLDGVGIAGFPKNIVATGGARLLFNDQVAGSATNQKWDMTATKAKLNLILIYSDVPVTLKTNSSGSPTETISIPAGEPVLWSANGPLTCPFSANITGGIFITVPGTTLANLLIAINLDS